MHVRGRFETGVHSARAAGISARAAGRATTGADPVAHAIQVATVQGTTTQQGGRRWPTNRTSEPRPGARTGCRPSPARPGSRQQQHQDAASIVPRSPRASWHETPAQGHWTGSTVCSPGQLRRTLTRRPAPADRRQLRPPHGPGMSSHSEPAHPAIRCRVCSMPVDASAVRGVAAWPACRRPSDRASGVCVGRGARPSWAWTFPRSCAPTSRTLGRRRRGVAGVTGRSGGRARRTLGTGQSGRGLRRQPFAGPAGPASRASRVVEGRVRPRLGGRCRHCRGRGCGRRGSPCPGPVRPAPRADVRAPWRQLDRRCARLLVDGGTPAPFDTGLLDLDLPASDGLVCLHGDLFPGNVRSRGGRVQLIDPAPWVGPPEHDTVHWALRVEDGRRWREHLTTVTGGRYDRVLAAALAPRTARTYVLYQLATGRSPSDEHLDLARRAVATGLR